MFHATISEGRVAGRASAAPARTRGAPEFHPSLSPRAPAGPATLRRKCDCGGSGATACSECERKETDLRRSAAGGVPSAAPPAVYSTLRSPGRPLERSTRALFEPRFGQTFGHVRVHTDDKAAQSASAVNAHAYTVGRDIVFGTGKYAPGTTAGAKLLAHELTHVAQQGGAAKAESSLRIGAEHDEAEAVADRIAGEYRDFGPMRPIRREPQAGVIRRAAIFEGRILDEGTCHDLVAGKPGKGGMPPSKYVCCDPDNGVERKGKTKDIDGAECNSQKFTNIFQCDKTCKTALQLGCSDSDNWMAIPKSRFRFSKCNEDLVICANGKSTHAHVRDGSDRDKAWEVSRAIPAALGVPPDFHGAIYANEQDSHFKKDKRCGTVATPAAPAPSTPAHAPEKAKIKT